MMNNERKRSSNCDKNAHQTSRFVDALMPNLEKFPSNCLKHILSFIPFEKISQMRQVSKQFNEISKRLLDEGHRELDRRLELESEKAEKRVLFPTNAYNMLQFLIDLQDVIHLCKTAYVPPVDYFVAGKLLDEANCLLNDFDNSKVVPYFREHAYDQRPHPILGPIVAHSEKARRHFNREIMNKIINRDDKLDFKLFYQNSLEALLFFKRNKMLNENVLGLTQMASKVDEEFQQIIKRGNMPIVPTNLSTCYLWLSTPSGVLLRETKLLGGPNEKRANLATLPPSCIQNIVSYLKCDKMAQLRIVCKSFNEACKKGLNEEFEKLDQKCAFRNKFEKQNNYYAHISFMRTRPNLMLDLYSLLQRCKNNYKRYLGSKFYFAAGKVLDEAECIYYRMHTHALELDLDYESRPYFALFPLINLVYKAITHFKFKIIPKYFPSTQNPIYIPDYIITDDAMNVVNENQLNLEELERLIEETDLTIMEQNIRNKKFLNFISGLEKKVFILKKEISKRYIVLKELK